MTSELMIQKVFIMEQCSSQTGNKLLERDDCFYITLNEKSQMLDDILTLRGSE